MRADRRIFTLVLAAAFLAAPHLRAEDWSRFRGPNGGGVSIGPAPPVELGPGTNVAWAVDVPFGRSTPAVAGSRIFLTAAEDERFLTLAIDRATGDVLWQSAVPRDREDAMYHDQDSASPSPVTDGENVYVFFQETGLVSYDGAGAERWRLPLGPFHNFYGLAASPVLAGGRLYLVCDQAIGSFLIAVDKDSGQVAWRRERPGRVESYATPVLYPDAQSPRALLVSGSQWLDAYDLGSGDTLWSVSGFAAGPVASPVLAGDWIFVAGPDQASEPLPPFEGLLEQFDGDGDGELVRDDLAETWMYNHFGFLDVDSSGRLTAGDWVALQAVMTAEGWGVFGLRVSAGGKAPEIAWNHRQNVPYIPTPIAVDGVLFTVEDGIVTSLDAATGEVLLRGRLDKGAPKVYASPVAAGGRIYFATLDGDVVVLSAAPQWEVLGVHRFEEPIYASPVLTDGHLVLRTKSKLYSFAAADASEPAAPAPTR